LIFNTEIRFLMLSKAICINRIVNIVVCGSTVLRGRISDLCLAGKQA